MMEIIFCFLFRWLLECGGDLVVLVDGVFCI